MDIIGGGISRFNLNYDTYLGCETETKSLKGIKTVRFGANTTFKYKKVNNSIYISNNTFGGDPCLGVGKNAYYTENEIYVSSSGSSYISGHENCIAIKSEADQAPKVSTYSNISDSIHYSGKYFINTKMKAGNEEMPTYDGNNIMNGNDGDGYCKITLIDY